MMAILTSVRWYFIVVLIFISLIISILSIFSCASWPSTCLFWRNVYSDLLLIFYGVVCFQILSCMSFLYVLEINLLSVSSFANIFSQSVGCLSILSMISYTVQKFLSLIGSHQFIFAFVSFTLETDQKIAAIYGKGCSAYAFLQEFYSIWSNI